MNNRLKVFCVTNRPIKLLENSDLILAGVGKDKFNIEIPNGVYFIRLKLEDGIYWTKLMVINS